LWRALTEMAPPVASVERSTFMSRPKGLIGRRVFGLDDDGGLRC
jgi:hypothetical protein